MLLLVFNAVFPILILILTGFLFSKSGVAKEQHAKSLNDVAFYLLFPALLIYATYSIKIRVDYEFLVTFILSSVFCYLIILIISSYCFKSDWRDSTAFALCASSSNTAYIGIPILTALFGYKSMLPIAISIVYITCIIQPIAIFFLTKKINFKRLLLNPLLVSSILGLLCSALGLQIPSAIENALKQMGNASIPCILIAIGINLYYACQIKLKNIDLKKVTLACLSKLILHPLLAILLYLPFAHHSFLGIVGVIAASLPTINSAPILCKQGGVFCGESELIVTMSTFFSLITLPLIIMFLMSK